MHIPLKIWTSLLYLHDCFSSILHECFVFLLSLCAHSLAHFKGPYCFKSVSFVVSSFSHQRPASLCPFISIYLHSVQLCLLLFNGVCMFMINASMLLCTMLFYDYHQVVRRVWMYFIHLYCFYNEVTYLSTQWQNTSQPLVQRVMVSGAQLRLGVGLG